MQRILLVKTTSLGDVIHCLPAASDIAVHFPRASLDWVVEETYVDVVRLHPAVGRVLPVALRRWRKHLLGRDTRDELIAFRRMLGSEPYDRVIDVQGLIKSALLARMARGEHHGLDRASAREALAALTYQRRHAVPWTLDAVARNRILVGAALGYVPRSLPDYGIHVDPGGFDWLAPGRYCVCLTGTTDAAKLWPEERWRELGVMINAAGMRCVLSHGTEAEMQRARRLQSVIGDALVTPSLGLSEMARLLAGATLAVGVDTGLTHLAGALGRPTIGIYCGTSPRATGVIAASARNVGDIAKTPGATAVWQTACDLLAAAREARTAL